MTPSRSWCFACNFCVRHVAARCLRGARHLAGSTSAPSQQNIRHHWPILSSNTVLKRCNRIVQSTSLASLHPYRLCVCRPELNRRPLHAAGAPSFRRSCTGVVSVASRRTYQGKERVLSKTNQSNRHAVRPGASHATALKRGFWLLYRLLKALKWG